MLGGERGAKRGRDDTTGLVLLSGMWGQEGMICYAMYAPSGERTCLLYEYDYPDPWQMLLTHYQVVMVTRV